MLDAKLIKRLRTIEETINLGNGEPISMKVGRCGSEGGTRMCPRGMTVPTLPHKSCCNGPRQSVTKPAYPARINGG